MDNQNRWQAFPNQKEESKRLPSGKAKKLSKKVFRKNKLFNLKTKFFLLLIFNLGIAAFYLYNHRQLNILEKVIFGLNNLEMSILLEILIFIVFIFLTLSGFFIWFYFFIRGVTYPADQQREKYFLRSWYETKLDIDTIIIIAFIIKLIIQPFSVYGSSMEPNFHNHQYIIVNTFIYRFIPPQRGDVIVFKYPFDKNKNYIKRIIGLPNERIVFKNNGIYIYNNEFKNGVKLNENYLPSGTKTIVKKPEFKDVTLKENEYFVLGDNRESSSDSREWGSLDRNLIIGKAWVICWPLPDWQTVPKINYIFNQ